MSISKKFLIPILAVLLISGIIASFIFWKYHKHQASELSFSLSRRVGPVLEESLDMHMLHQDRGSLEKIFDNLGKIETIKGISLVNGEGIVKMGTDTGMVGKSLPKDSLGCHGCHERGSGGIAYKTADAYRYVQHVSNKTACHGCHNPRFKYNGAFIIDFNLSDLDSQITKELRMWLWIFFPSLIVVGVFILALTRQVIQKRIDTFIQGIQTLREGNYTVRLPVEKNDEITRFTEAFNQMADAIHEHDTEKDILFSQISHAHEIWQNTFDSINDLISINDEDCTIVRANQAFQSYFGMTPTDLANRNCCELICGAAFPSEDLFMNKTIRERKVADGEIVNKNLNRTFHVTTYPYDYPGAEFQGFILVARDITERKKAERAFKEQFEFLQTMIDTIPSPVFYKDAEGRYLGCNKAFEEFIGTPENEIIGKTVYDMGPKEIADKYHEADRELFANHGKQAYEWKVRRGNGETREVIFNKATFLNASGSVAGLIGIITDITERKKAEEIIRHNYDLQATINSILRIGLENITLEEILQQTLSCILSLPWLSIESKGCIFIVGGGGDTLELKASTGLPPGVQETCSILPFGKCLCGRAALTQKIQFADSLNNSHEIHYDAIVPHGHYCVPIVASGKTLGVINLYLREGHPHDTMETDFLNAVANTLPGIIKRKWVEQERERLMRELDEALYKIMRSQKEWVSTFDSITDMIAIIDKDFNVLRVNRAFANYFGMTPQEVLGKKCYDLLHSEMSPIDNCPHVITMNENHTATGELVDQKSRKVFQISTFPYYGPSGEIVGSIHITRDVTEEREKEMRLILSERLASLGQLASGVAHEINNPLAAIGGCAEGLLNRVKEGRLDLSLLENYLSIIQEEVQRCKNITGSMLSFVRKSSYERKNVYINDLLKKTLELVGFQGRLKNIEVIERYAESLPPVIGNEGEIKQAFLAIFTNAVDAMEQGGTITVETGNQDSGVIAKISDTGSGIPAQYINRIFDPFFTLKAEKGGTGLGLSIANRIIIQHSGTIEVFSEEGKGTLFSITFHQE